MTKTFSKVLAVILSLCMMFAVSVCASAEDGFFSISGSSFKAITADWNNDYIGRVKMTVTGGMTGTVAEDIIIKITINDVAEPIKTVSASEAEITYNGGAAEIAFNLDRYINHGDTYNFTIVEGTFADAAGELNSEYTASVTGNALLETIDTSAVPVTPVGKIIAWLQSIEANEYFQWLIDAVINVLNWFVTI